MQSEKEKMGVNQGYIYVTNYSNKFRNLIQSIAEMAEKLLPSKKLEGMGVFLFGSPSRQEMIDESDADIMIVRKSDSKEYGLFRKEFIMLLEKENFAKIDVPDWGTYEDCELYLKHSITEGNQVVEAKFIYGDPDVNSFIDGLRDKYCSVYRFEKVLCFQKLYFDQYYTQRTQPGIKNVKYGHGGTRDFMFITWFANMLDSEDGRKINLEDNFPLVYKSLSSLYERKLLCVEDYKKYLESINVVLILRNEILIQNKWSENEGLTYLDDKTISILFKRELFKNGTADNEESLRDYLISNVNNVAELKSRIWELFIEHLCNRRGHEWTKLFKKFASGNIFEEDLEKIPESDELLQMVLIWNVNSVSNKELFSKIFDKYSKSDSWTILASLCCHPQCSPEVLDFIATGMGFKKGYEYLLRVISRNANVNKETLKKIFENPNLEERYKNVAKTSFDKGVGKANELR